MNMASFRQRDVIVKKLIADMREVCMNLHGACTVQQLLQTPLEYQTVRNINSSFHSQPC